MTFWGANDITDDGHVLLSFVCLDNTPYDFLLPIDLVELPNDELGTLTWISKYLEWRNPELNSVMTHISKTYRINFVEPQSSIEKLQHIAASLGYTLIPIE